MKNKRNRLGDAAKLRARAERSARENPGQLPENIEALSPEEARRTLHELRVHQIELEMQNEELRRAQIALDTVRARYFDLYDLAPVGYCTLDEKGIILEANLAATTLLGVGRGTLVKQRITRFVAKDDQDIYYLRHKILVETDEPQTFELRMVKKDGMEFMAHLVAAASQYDGTPVYRVVMSDISERKRSEQALEKVRGEAQNERLRLDAVMQVLPTGVAITDAVGGTVQTNGEFERIWSGPRPVTHSVKDYAAFKAWWADTGRPVAPEEWASVQAVRTGRPVMGQVLEIERFDGSRAFVINSATPVRSAAGDLIGSAVTIHDITDLRRTQDALRMAELSTQKLNKALQEHVATVETVNQELESYSRSVSHDLRTPLRFVNRIAHALLHDPEARLSRGAAAQVNMILQATSEMSKLMENLLRFSQVSREKMIKRRVGFRRLCQEVVNELEHAVEGRDVEIVIQNLASCQGNRMLLRDVVMNLLDNALKFTRRREKARIMIGCTETAAEADAVPETVYFVQDNGVGFDMKDSDSLFHPFHRLHKPEDFEGTGIGLALVKRIIDRHGGRIWATSEVDKGATFYFTVGKENEE